MKKTIWKFGVKIDDTIQFNMPMGAKVLSVQTQMGEPCIWAEVDPDAKKELRRFHFRGTGHRLTGDEGAFVGTIQLLNGTLVFHLYEAKEQ